MVTWVHALYSFLGDIFAVENFSENPIPYILPFFVDEIIQFIVKRSQVMFCSVLIILF